VILSISISQTAGITGVKPPHLAQKDNLIDENQVVE
jgi:hypothetical protein